MKTPIVIPLHPEGGKFKDNSELRFALRSLEKHFIGEFEVAIVSTHLPDWIQGVRHIYGEGLKSSLRAAAKAYPDGFFWWYDDNCLLLPTDGETMKITPIAHHWSKPSTEWRKRLEEVKKRLQSEGLPCHDFSSPHGPYWFDLAMVEEAFTDWPGMSGKFPVESWILSKRNWPTVKGQTSQYYGRFKTPPGPQHRYLNYNDGGNTKEIRRFLDGAFRISTRFEKPDPEFMNQETVRGVVISLSQRPRWEETLVEAMGAVGIAVDRFEGTDAHMGDAPVMAVNRKLFEKEFKREPLAGEIGCYSSHIKIAQARDTLPALCDEFPDWHLVFEDDAVPRNMDASKMVAIVRMAVELGYDLVMLNIGRDNRRLNRPLSISPSRRKDPFTHAYVANKKALAEMSGWTMRHPIDLAISKSNKLKIGLLGGKHRFDQQPNAESTFSIHRERKGEPAKFDAKPMAETPFGIRKIHQVWIGKESIRPRFKAYTETIRKSFEGWEYKLWGNDDLPSLAESAILPDVVLGSGIWGTNKLAIGIRSDVIRLEIIRQHGGIYFDIDYEALHEDIGRYFNGASGFIYSDQRVADPGIGIIGSDETRNAVVELYLRRIAANLTPPNGHGDILRITGPERIKEVLQYWMAGKWTGGVSQTMNEVRIRTDFHAERITAFEWNIFHPYWLGTDTWATFDPLKHPHAAAAHHWAASWK